MLVVALAAIGATLVASVALATNSHPSVRTGISVFSHRPKALARIATSGSLNPPPGAILASVSGHNEIYAWHHAAGEDCVMNLHVHGAGGAVCGEAAKVEAVGTVGVFEEGEGATAPNSPATLRVAALVPNGVNSVTFTDRSGTSYAVAVTNNVVESEDINISSVSYKLPNGETHATDVASVVDRGAHQPGPAGSSRTE